MNLLSDAFAAVENKMIFNRWHRFGVCVSLRKLNN